MFNQEQHLASTASMPDRLRDIRNKEDRLRRQAVGSSPEFFKHIKTINISAPLNVTNVSINVNTTTTMEVRANAIESKYEVSHAVNRELKEEDVPVRNKCCSFLGC